MINDYRFNNNFEIKYVNNKLYIYYYDLISSFTSNDIIVKKDNLNLYIKGDNLIISTMFKEYLIINGVIKLIEFKYE